MKEHDHIHHHGHTEKHEHHHGHTHAHSHSADEAAALLKYLLDHNQHHLEELENLTTHADGDAKSILCDAVSSYREANESLAQYIQAIGGE